MPRDENCPRDAGGDEGDWNKRSGRAWEGAGNSARAQSSQANQSRTTEPGLTWKKMDLHLHTPASSDYRDPGITYLDVLKKAEEKSLDMIAFADHNTVGGYSAMHREIETLTLLEKLNRLTDEERATLNEYRRLLGKIVVLPAFEFTATFGFHILGVFPENTSVRKLEYSAARPERARRKNGHWRARCWFDFRRLAGLPGHRCRGRPGNRRSR